MCRDGMGLRTRWVRPGWDRLGGADLGVTARDLGSGSAALYSIPAARTSPQRAKNLGCGRCYSVESAASISITAPDAPSNTSSSDAR
jgi:hypothetical protein